MRKQGWIVALAFIGIVAAPAAAAPAPRTNKLVTHKATNASHGAVGGSGPYAMSADGRFVAYEYTPGANDDIVEDFVDNTGGSPSVFLFDRSTGENVLVSRAHDSSTGGDTGNGFAQGAVISADGRFVAFRSNATDLIDGFGDDPNVFGSIFVFDRTTGENQLVSHAAGNQTAESNASPGSAFAINTDGSKIAYRSPATDLIVDFDDEQDDANESDVYLYNRGTGANRLVSHAHNDPSQGSNDANTQAFLELPVSINSDSRFVAYTSRATNLTPLFDKNNNADDEDIYLYDATTDRNTLVTRDRAAADNGSNGANGRPVLSANGARIAFESTATNIANFTDNNGSHTDVFAWTRASNTSRLVSFSAAGGPTQGAGPTGGFNGSLPLISNNGLAIAYESSATNLITGFQNQNSTQNDIYLWTEKTVKRRKVFRKVFRNVLVTRQYDDPRAGQSGFGIPHLWGFSGGGNHVLYGTGGKDAIAMFGENPNPGDPDMYIFDATTGKAVLASRRVETTTVGANGQSSAFTSQRALSANGLIAVYRSAALNLVHGFVDGNGAQSDLYVFGP